ncbi:MAG TPA: cobyrinate a,c-diamide synthase [Methanomassiliicoccales archaeon]|nr:cobyrinate a,c-diamide synthase [Methanomassiliicoccales archaeon]
MIAGERSGVGKSTLTIGIMSALASRGLAVQPFKSGPDFLDPMHHRAATGRASRNLDTWMFPAYVLESFGRASNGADVSVIEGGMGLYDGFSGSSEEGSAAHLSKVLGCPVVLVIDAAASARSAGAVALGFKHYDEDVKIAGVVFNNVAGEKHRRSLEASLKGIECLGGIPRLPPIELPERHLGLVPAEESGDGDRIGEIQHVVEENVNVERILEIARSAPPLPPIERRIVSSRQRCVIAVARDPAFNFYYEDNFDILWNLGASLMFFSPLRDDLPIADGYYFGGGYPEVFAEGLAANARMKDHLRREAGRGAPVYAECGGLMYLCSSVTDLNGGRHRMCGVFEAEAEMMPKLQAVSYVEVRAVRDNLLAKSGWGTRGHVFHFSRIVDVREPTYSYELKGGAGIEGAKDGLVVNGTLASYTHLHFGSCPDFARRFVDACADRAGK